MVCFLEEVNRLDNSTKFKAFEALDVSEKNIVYYQSTAQSPLRLSRPLSIGGRKTVGRLSRPKAESGVRGGEQ